VTLKRHAAALVCVFALIGIATAAPAGAATVGTGTVKCAIGGKLTFNPPLKNGGTSAETIKVKVTLGHCTGTGSGTTVAGGTATGTTTRPNNDCSGLAGTNTTPLVANTVWTVKTGQPALVNTKVKYTSTTGNATDPPSFDTTGKAIKGSFTGDTATAHAVLKQSLATVLNECGGAGVSVLNINSTTSTASLS
jgi:hypothetical protein